MAELLELDDEDHVELDAMAIPAAQPGTEVTSNDIQETIQGTAPSA